MPSDGVSVNDGNQADTIALVVGGKTVGVERAVFAALFYNSVVSAYADVEKTLSGNPLPFRDFLSLTQKAEIPYPLFFAPLPVVERQIELKTQKLMKGFTRGPLAIHSRNSVQVHDVELIIKDLMRKQSYLRKHDHTLTDNRLIGALRKFNGSAADAAATLSQVLGVDSSGIRAAPNKSAAVDLMITRLEASQVLVSQSSRLYMPQLIPSHAKFSGITVRDKKVPYIFLASGDESDQEEPHGRRLFTLALLTTLIARNVFAPINFNGHSKDDTSPWEYTVAAEFLMPENDVRGRALGTLDDLRQSADFFKVTPSAMVMRARRLGILTQADFAAHMDALQREYAARVKGRAGAALAANALRKYNGVECSRRMLALLDAGVMNRTDFRRMVLLNKMPASQLAQFRAAVS